MVPIIKWVGSKRLLIKRYIAYLPNENSYSRYYEPFLGSAAMFLYLYQKLVNKKVYLNDLNEELINFYQTIRYNPIEIFLSIKSQIVDKENYLKMRARDILQLTRIERAARFYYLNKTAFNGLWRENKKGEFNVPFNNAKSIQIDLGDLITTGAAMKIAQLNSGDYYSSLYTSAIAKDVFVYLDPPYMPLNATSNFTSYQKNNFTIKDQERLADLVKMIDGAKGKFMLSNSDTPFIRDLYKGFNIHTIQANRMINCKGDKRSAITELLITNY